MLSQDILLSFIFILLLQQCVFVFTVHGLIENELSISASKEQYFAHLEIVLREYTRTISPAKP